MHDYTAFIQVNLLLIVMFFSSFYFRKVGVPPIISFMVVGLLARPLINPESTYLLDLFKEAGIILLFFFIGLEYSIERLKNLFRMVRPALVDLLVNFLPVFGLSLLFGFDPITSLLIAGMFYPTSTSITAKLLMDYKRLANPEAELLIGLLIFEDLFAIILISVLIPLKSAEAMGAGFILASFAKLSAVFVGYLLLHRYGVPRLKGFFERISEEESFVFFILGLVLVWGLSFKLMGVSEVLGAFLLGVLIPEGKVMSSVERHLSSIKELSIGVFFFFFAYSSEVRMPESLLFLILLVILGVVLKVISTYWAGKLYGMKGRTLLRTSLSFTPRGEFSVVISSFDPVVKTLSIPFIFISAIFGSFLFAVAPAVAGKIHSLMKGRTSHT